MTIYTITVITARLDSSASHGRDIRSASQQLEWYVLENVPGTLSFTCTLGTPQAFHLGQEKRSSEQNICICASASVTLPGKRKVSPRMRMRVLTGRRVTFGGAKGEKQIMEELSIVMLPGPDGGCDVGNTTDARAGENNHIELFSGA